MSKKEKNKFIFYKTRRGWPLKNLFHTQKNALKLAGREQSSRFCPQMALEHDGKYETTGHCKGRRHNCGPWINKKKS